MFLPEKLQEIEVELGSTRALARAIRELEKRELKRSFLEPDGRGLLNFIRHFWHILEPGRDFQDGWAILAMCRYLQAVTDGRITRLLINVPPGSMKSLLVNVFWPAWEWGPAGKPSMRYVSFSYGAHLTARDNQKFGDLIADPIYQDLYGKNIELRERGKIKVSNTKTGWKFATSVGGTSTGERGDRVLLDDPHNVKESESETVREETVRWFKEAMSNRLNDMEKSAIIVIMQRVHEDDVSGCILADKLPYIHLMIPMEFEPDRRTVTFIGNRLFWADPRRHEDECFWPERFPPAAVVECKLLGEHAFAGQYQQRPEPRGGGLFKREYWGRWEKPKFPALNYVVASLDGAFTEKKENDPCGFTVWGAFTTTAGDKAAISLTAWRKHLPLNKNVRPREPGESWARYKLETEAEWGLIQWLHYECARWGGVDKLLVENKANGHDVVSELLRQFSWSKFVVELVDPGSNDKWARALACQPFFAEGLIFTLDDNQRKTWVKTLVDELAIFPRGRYDDQVDSATQALRWMRRNGLLVMAAERKALLIEQETFKRQQAPLYEI